MRFIEDAAKEIVERFVRPLTIKIELLESENRGLKAENARLWKLTMDWAVELDARDLHAKKD